VVDAIKVFAYVELDDVPLAGLAVDQPHPIADAENGGERAFVFPAGEAILNKELIEEGIEFQVDRPLYDAREKGKRHDDSLLRHVNPMLTVGLEVKGLLPHLLLDFQKIRVEVAAELEDFASVPFGLASVPVSPFEPLEARHFRETVLEHFHAAITPRLTFPPSRHT